MFLIHAKLSLVKTITSLISCVYFVIVVAHFLFTGNIRQLTDCYSAVISLRRLRSFVQPVLLFKYKLHDGCIFFGLLLVPVRTI